MRRRSAAQLKAGDPHPRRRSLAPDVRERCEGDRVGAGRTGQEGVKRVR